MAAPKAKWVSVTLQTRDSVVFITMTLIELTLQPADWEQQKKIKVLHEEKLSLSPAAAETTQQEHRCNLHFNALMFDMCVNGAYYRILLLHFTA